MVVQSVPAFVEKIIVVDDASKDKTFQTVSLLKNPRVVLLQHEENRGVGGAMLTGYAEAAKLGMDIFVKMDGDGQMRPEHMAALVAPLAEGRADYAKGNRFTDFKTIIQMPRLRRFGNAWLSFFVKMVSGYWNIFDVTNGYTALSAAMYRKMDLKSLSRGYFFETSMLIELNTNEARVADVHMPAVYEDEESHLRVGKVVSLFPFLMLSGFMRRFYRRYMLKDFNVLSVCFLIGLPLFLFGFAYGVSIWIHPPVYGQPTPAGTVMLAALPIILGFQLLLAALILDVVSVPK